MAGCSGSLDQKDSKSQPPEPISLFDGKTFTGWHYRDEEKHLWRIQDGALSGGSLSEFVKHNSFLMSEQRYQNFELNLKVKITSTEGFSNSGIQVRSVRMPNHHEMIGYQVDVGPEWWGKMYDESRRNKTIAEAADLDVVNAAINEDGWNHYRILCEGLRIRSWINGVPAIDFTESDLSIAQEGHLGIQIHGGGKALVQVKDISITELPNTPELSVWQ